MSLPTYTHYSASIDPADSYTSTGITIGTSGLSFVDPTTGVISLSGTSSTTIGSTAIGMYTLSSPTYTTYIPSPYAGMTEVDHESGIMKVFDGVEWQVIKIQDPNKIETEEERVEKEFNLLVSDIKQEIYG